MAFVETLLTKLMITFYVQASNNRRQILKPVSMPTCLFVCMFCPAVLPCLKLLVWSIFGIHVRWVQTFQITSTLIVILAFTLRAEMTSLMVMCSTVVVSYYSFQVYLPYGTAMRVRIDNEPYMGPEGGKVLDISILPSIHDKQYTRGLCGTLNDDDSDDFHARTNTKEPKPLTDDQKDEFIFQWLVQPNESLFSSNVFTMELNQWVFPTCVCTNDANTPNCERSTSGCTKGTVTGEHSCSDVLNRRSVRSIDRRPRIPRIKLPLSQSRHIRAKVTCAMFALLLSENTCIKLIVILRSVSFFRNQILTSK